MPIPTDLKYIALNSDWTGCVEKKVTVGTRVIVSKADKRADRLGQCGTVKYISTGILSVEFDNVFDGGHDCDGTCVGGKGWFFYNTDSARRIEKVESFDNLDVIE